ncbi:MAG TPA: hypothetical protein VI953_00655 [Candidatus Paceibacterota bacterium]
MYLKWAEERITDWSETNVERMYGRGFVFTRLGKGVMQQTRSMRVDLSKFELSSENRRILGKTDELGIVNYELWDGSFKYDWSIAKMAKDFYDTKFGDRTFSANKAKELLTDETKSNFNTLLNFGNGYAICYASKNILHYSYPFYSLSGETAKSMGLGMMTQAVQWAKEVGKKYVYLGSAQRPTDTYKLQFTGIEWWDGSKWNTDLDLLKQTLKE